MAIHHCLLWVRGYLALHHWIPQMACGDASIVGFTSWHFRIWRSINVSMPFFQLEAIFITNFTSQHRALQVKFDLFSGSASKNSKWLCVNLKQTSTNIRTHWKELAKYTNIYVHTYVYMHTFKSVVCVCMYV